MIAHNTLPDVYSIHVCTLIPQAIYVNYEIVCVDFHEE